MNIAKGTKHNLNTADIERVYEELQRRLLDEALLSESEWDLLEIQKSMMQGAYAALMAVSGNWSDVVRMMEGEEQKRNWWQYQEEEAADDPDTECQDA